MSPSSAGSGAGDSGFAGPANGVAAEAPRRCLDIFLLTLLMMPSLVWILLERGIWSADASRYAADALRLSHALWSSEPGWWRELIDVTGVNPPGLVLVAHLFVPVGALIGHVEVGLRLALWVLQIVGLWAVYEAVLGVWGRRSLALLGGLTLASAPVFVEMGKVLMLQPLQLAVVAGFLALLARPARSDPGIVLLQLAALGLAALLTMLSTPGFCFLLGLAVLWRVWLARERLAFGRRHLPWIVVVAGLALLTIAWSLERAGDALAYARYAFQHPWAAEVSGGTAAKLGRWLAYLAEASFLPPVGVGVLLLSIVALLRGRGGSPSRPWIPVVVGIQALAALAILVSSGQQTFFYVLPFAVFLPFWIVWLTTRIPAKGIAGGIAVVLLIQWGAVHAGEFGVVRIADRFWWAPLQIEPDRRTAIVDGVLDVVLDASGAPVVVETNFFHLGRAYFHFRALHRPDFRTRSAEGREAAILTADLMVTENRERVDLEGVWSEILGYESAYFVMPDPERRRIYAERLARGQSSAVPAEQAALTLAERAAASPRFERVPAAGLPEVEIYRLLPGASDG